MALTFVRWLALGLTVMLGTTSVRAAAVTVEYELVSLGGSAYEYRYTLRNDTAADVFGFTLDFDESLYDFGSLAISGSGVSNWGEQIFSPVPGLPPQYDVFALSDPLSAGESLAGFSVQFSWLGAGAPGSQQFLYYDASFAPLESGLLTVAANTPPGNVPEPASLALVLAALGGLGASRRRAA